MPNKLVFDSQWYCPGCGYRNQEQRSTLSISEHRKLQCGFCGVEIAYTQHQGSAQVTVYSLEPVTDSTAAHDALYQ